MEQNFLKEYCLSQIGAVETYPFVEQASVYKIGSKMFALLNLEESPTKITLKCDPYIAEELRQKHSSIQPGYYMNKKHWNTIEIDGSIEDKQILEMIDISYHLVFSGLKKSEKDEIRQLG